jgi:hypothetical protein
MLLPTTTGEVGKLPGVASTTGWHVCTLHAPPWHVWPHVPQLLASLTTHAPPQQIAPPAQSLADEQVVPHAVPLVHAKFPVHAAGVTVGQLPAPSQLTSGVRVPFMHDKAPQLVVAACCSHTPPAAHLPSLPHVVVTAHWPEGAGVAGVYGLHVPSGIPVSACVQPMQVPVHA